MDDKIVFRYIMAHVRMHGGNPDKMSADQMLDCFAILPPPSKSIDEFYASIDPDEGQRQAINGLNGVEGVTIERKSDGSDS